MQKPDIAFIPTPDDALEAMLNLAQPQPEDCLYDLGCGDGRVVIEAARRFGNRAVGIDVDAKYLAIAHAHAKAANVEHLTCFRQENVYEADFSDATIVMVYLLPHLNVRLRPRLWEQLRPGTRIISHQFDMGDWQPQQMITLDGSEEDSTIYQWTVGEGHPRVKKRA